MKDKIPKEIIDILKAVPCKEDSELPFEMPKNHETFPTELLFRKDRKIIKEKERL